MANQFNTKIRFDACGWRAFDKETQISALVADNPDGVSWSISRMGPGLPLVREGGMARTPQAGRAACRRAIARIAKEMGIKRKGKK